MRKVVFTVAAAGALMAAAALGQAGNAAAAGQDQGYGVQINGVSSGPMSPCTVKHVPGLPGMTPWPGHLDLAYLDVACASNDN